MFLIFEIHKVKKKFSRNKVWQYFISTYHKVIVLVVVKKYFQFVSWLINFYSRTNSYLQNEQQSTSYKKISDFAVFFQICSFCLFFYTKKSNFQKFGIRIESIENLRPYTLRKLRFAKLFSRLRKVMLPYVLSLEV